MAPAQCLPQPASRRAISSTAYAVTRPLLSLSALLLRRAIAQDAELLVLRREKHGPAHDESPHDRGGWLRALLDGSVLPGQRRTA